MSEPLKVYESLNSAFSIGCDPITGIHILNPQSKNYPIKIVANGGAQLMNSHHYADRYSSPESAEIVRTNQELVTGFMLAFSNSGDLFYFTSSNPSITIATLQKIHDSYARVGISIARDYRHVEDIDKVDFRDSAVKPHVFSPEILRPLGMAETGIRNVLAYKKNVHQFLWNHYGIPTPPTSYLNGNAPDNLRHDLEMFRNYEELVVNGPDGCGGYGFMITPNSHTVVQKIKDESKDVLQVQGRLPLLTSPGVSFYIGDTDIVYLGGAEQRFIKPGQHAGNIWTKGIEDEWNNTFSDFNKTIFAGVRVLQNFGVRGNVNLDVLGLAEEVSRRYGLSRVLLREANIRPGGSAVMFRLQSNADVDGLPPSTIITNTAVCIRPEVFFDSELLGRLNCERNMRTVIYNYYKPQERAYLAFMGNDRVTISDVQAYEEATLRDLHTWG
ncbi:MAG: hypothetical protein Q7S61_02605 [bacterium]|nr:hypothetical protein [bacterium]